MNGLPELARERQLLQLMAQWLHFTLRGKQKPWKPRRTYERDTHRTPVRGCSAGKSDSHCRNAGGGYV